MEMLLKFIIRAGVLLKGILGYFFQKPYIRGPIIRHTGACD
jgi:hypothetical protein